MICRESESRNNGAVYVAKRKRHVLKYDLPGLHEQKSVSCMPMDSRYTLICLRLYYISALCFVLSWTVKE